MKDILVVQRVKRSLWISFVGSAVVLMLASWAAGWEWERRPANLIWFVVWPVLSALLFFVQTVWHEWLDEKMKFKGK